MVGAASSAAVRGSGCSVGKKWRRRLLEKELERRLRVAAATVAEAYTCHTGTLRQTRPPFPDCLLIVYRCICTRSARGFGMIRVPSLLTRTLATLVCRGTQVLKYFVRTPRALSGDLVITSGEREPDTPQAGSSWMV